MRCIFVCIDVVNNTRGWVEACRAVHGDECDDDCPKEIEAIHKCSSARAALILKAQTRCEQFGHSAAQYTSVISSKAVALSIQKAGATNLTKSCHATIDKTAWNGPCSVRRRLTILYRTSSIHANERNEPSQRNYMRYSHTSSSVGAQVNNSVAPLGRAYSAGAPLQIVERIETHPSGRPTR